MLRRVNTGAPAGVKIGPPREAEIECCPFSPGATFVAFPGDSGGVKNLCKNNWQNCRENKEPLLQKQGGGSNCSISSKGACTNCKNLGGGDPGKSNSVAASCTGASNSAASSTAESIPNWLNPFSYHNMPNLFSYITTSPTCSSTPQQAQPILGYRNRYTSAALSGGRVHLSGYVLLLLGIAYSASPWLTQPASH